MSLATDRTLKKEPPTVIVGPSSRDRDAAAGTPTGEASSRPTTRANHFLKHEKSAKKPNSLSNRSRHVNASLVAPFVAPHAGSVGQCQRDGFEYYYKNNVRGSSIATDGASHGFF